MKKKKKQKRKLYKKKVDETCNKDNENINNEQEQIN